MLASEMEPGHKVSIMVDELAFESELRVARDEYLLIDIIVVEEKIINFPESMKTSFVYYDENEKLFVWEQVSVVPVKFKNGNKYHKVVLPKEEGKRYNRRGNFRIFIGEQMKVVVKKSTERITLMPIIKDISATGFSFVYGGDFEIGQRVSLYYNFGEGRIIEFMGKIVRKQPKDDSKDVVFGCSINDPSGMMRKIVNAVQQRKLSEKMSSSK